MDLANQGTIIALRIVIDTYSESNVRVTGLRPQLSIFLQLEY